MNCIHRLTASAAMTVFFLLKVVWSGQVGPFLTEPAGTLIVNEKTNSPGINLIFYSNLGLYFYVLSL